MGHWCSHVQHLQGQCMSVRQYDDECSCGTRGIGIQCLLVIQHVVERVVHLPILPLLRWCDEGPLAGVRVIYPSTAQHFRLHHTARLTKPDPQTNAQLITA